MPGFLRLPYDAVAQEYDGCFKSITHRAENEALLKILCEFMSQGEILDVGCGTGFLLDLFNGQIAPEDYTGIDISERMLERARLKYPGHEFKRADMVDLPLGDESVDLVISLFSAWSYCLNPIKAIFEAHRVLKQGGKILAMVNSPRYATRGSYILNREKIVTPTLYWTPDPLRASFRGPFDNLDIQGLNYEADEILNEMTQARAARLLYMSMLEDGFTQPILVQPDNSIVDGEHRWTCAIVLEHFSRQKIKNLPTDEQLREARYRALDLAQTYKDLEIPVVYVDMTPEQMRIATLRHNRARGSEDVELSVQVLRDLEALGALDWAQDSLMISDAELQKLMEDIPAPEALASEEFSQSWVPSSSGDEMVAIARSGDPTGSAKIGDLNLSMTQGAAKTIREREILLKGAKKEEDRKQIEKDQAIYRVSIIFSGEEAKVVKKVMGAKPAERILELCMGALS